MNDFGGYVVRGENHEREGLKCQDYIYGARAGSTKAIALADGAGATDYAYMGARTAARTAVGCLLDRFDELYQMEYEELQYRIIVAVRRELFALCSAWQLRLEDVQSTLLCAASDEAQSRMVLLHLGSGFIVREGRKGKKICSYPQEGENSNEPFLTSMIPGRDSIRVYRGSADRNERIYLLSDGWEELMEKNEDILRFASTKLPYQGRTQDDVSLISMYL